MLKTTQVSPKIKIEIDEYSRTSRAVATQKFLANQVIYKANEFLILPKPTYQSVQVDSQTHVIDILLANMNHSCEPTTFIDCKKLEVIANKEIEAGAELTFFYPSTEWEMAKPFECRCGSINCLNYISGSVQTPTNILGRYKLNQHIKSLLTSRYNLCESLIQIDNN